MPFPRIDAVCLEVDQPVEAHWAIIIRTFDANRCKWDVADLWGGVAGEVGQSLGEALGLMSDLAESLLSRAGCQLELPFP